MSLKKNETDNIKHQGHREWELSYANGEHVKCYNHSGKLAVFTKSNAFLPYDPGTTFLGIYSRKIITNVHENTCTRQLIAFLFSRAPNWEQLKFSSAGEQMISL